MRDGNSFVGLLKELTHQIKIFLQQEIQLAKTEISEKISSLGKDAAMVAVGGFVAWTGLIVLLGGLGLLLAFVFESLGWQPLFAAFAGPVIIGLLVIAVGGLLLLKGIKAFSKESFVPKRTIETLHHMKGTEPAIEVEGKEKEKKPTSEEIEACVMETEDRMAKTLEELAHRVTLTNLRRKATMEVQTHRFKWGLIAMGTGLAGSYLMKKKLRC